MSSSRKRDLDLAENNLQSAIKDTADTNNADRWDVLTKAIEEYSAAVFEIASFSKVLALEATEAVAKSVGKDRAAGLVLIYDHKPLRDALQSLVKASRDGDVEGAKIAHAMLTGLSQTHSISFTDKKNLN